MKKTRSTLSFQKISTSTSKPGNDSDTELVKLPVPPKFRVHREEPPSKLLLSQTMSKPATVTHQKQQTPETRLVFSLPKPAEAPVGPLDHFGWKRLTKEEAAERSRAEFRKMAATVADRARQEEDAKERKKLREREQARLRKQKSRHMARERKAAGSIGSRQKAVLLGRDTHRTELSDLPEISRPSGLEWKRHRNGRRKGAIQGKHKRVNWFHPFFVDPYCSHCSTGRLVDSYDGSNVAAGPS